MNSEKAGKMSTLRRILMAGALLSGCSETGSGSNWLQPDVASSDLGFTAKDVSGASDAAADAGGTGKLDAVADAAGGKDSVDKHDGAEPDGQTGDVNPFAPDVTNLDTGASATADLAINEVACEEVPDWFEVYNPGNADVDLAGWSFSDSIGDAAKRAAFPANSVVPASGFLVVEVTTEANGFKLGAAEELGIFRPDGSKADSVKWTTGACPTGSSYSRIPDGTGKFQTTKTQTPDKPNQK